MQTGAGRKLSENNANKIIGTICWFYIKRTISEEERGTLSSSVSITRLFAKTLYMPLFNKLNAINKVLKTYVRVHYLPCITF